MNKVQPYLIVVGLTIVVMTAHFTSQVFSRVETSSSNHQRSLSEPTALFVASDFSSKDLSDLFGFDYEAITPVPANQQANEKEELRQITLDDVSVIINAISKVNDTSIIYVSYKLDGKNHRQKIAVGDDLLGFSLVEVTGNSLTFERDEQFVEHKIFKSGQRN